MLFWVRAFCKYFFCSVVLVGSAFLLQKLVFSHGNLLFNGRKKVESGEHDIDLGLLRSSLKLMMDGQRSLYPSNVLDYCNGIDALSAMSESSVDGKLSFNEKSEFKLLQAYVLFRHGDKMPTYLRSDVIPIPKLKCSFPGALPLQWSDLNRFKLVPLTDGLTLNPSLHSGPLIKCRYGILTSYGYYQQYFNGQYIKKTYPQLFSRPGLFGRWSDSIFVHSTSYERTQQSAASFLMGLLGDDATDVPIHVSKGITLYGLPPGSTSVYRWCPKLREIIAKELSSGEFKSGEIFFSNVTERVAADMGVSMWKISPKITSLHDQIMGRACHGMPLPCGKRGCIDQKLMSDIANYANWASAHTYPMGTSVLMMQPFIYNTLFQQMNHAIEMDKKGDSNFFKALIHFCHDSTLSAIMAALDIPQKKIVPYAGHVTFELWKKETVVSKRTEEDSWYYSPYFIRILVNGQTVTQELQMSTADFELARELLKFRSWKDYISSGRFRKKQSYDEVCGLSSPSTAEETISIPISEQGGE